VREVRGIPDTLSSISPTLSFPVSQAGWRGNIFLILMRFVHGEGASGPPVMLNPNPRLFLVTPTSEVLVRGENSGRSRVLGAWEEQDEEEPTCCLSNRERGFW
jgi:hypothetical protein